MHQPYTQLYLHLVWATWDRLPLVRPEIRNAIYGCIQDQLRKHRCEVIAIGGMPDHVHVLTRFPTTVPIATIVKHGCVIQPDDAGAQAWRILQVAGLLRRVHDCQAARARVRGYVLNQEAHHRTGHLSRDLERVSGVPLSAQADSVRL